MIEIIILDYFGVMTLKRAYLLKYRNKNNLKERISRKTATSLDESCGLYSF